MKNKILSAFIAICLAFIACIEVDAAGNECYNDYGCSYGEYCHIGRDHIKGHCVNK